MLDGLRLRELREEAGMSPGELDEAAELEPGSVARAEDAGEGVYAPVEVIWKLARALDVSPTVLLKR
jgi:transcriptional regulator with XRE-family HTH domain